MSRPETIEDVPSYQRDPHTFIQVDPQFLTTDITVGAAILNLIVAARASDVFEVSEDGEFKVTLPLTDVEIQQRISAAQRSWDYDEADYEKVNNGEHIETWRKSAIDNWVKQEGRDPIDWSEYQEFRDNEAKKAAA